MIRTYLMRTCLASRTRVAHACLIRARQNSFLPGQQTSGYLIADAAGFVRA
ncbi:hypothetical protein GCM10009827_038360 [Dactylosporangium maewongense]|uniref:Uncharacterized protein n=1 Tax=Dactylosporangium maewongense TaxID=634393 RepID=A0ABN2AHE2_9ACTN